MPEKISNLYECNTAENGNLFAATQLPKCHIYPLKFWHITEQKIRDIPFLNGIVVWIPVSLETPGKLYSTRKNIERLWYHHQ